MLKNNYAQCTDWNFQTAHQIKLEIQKQQDNMEIKNNTESRIKHKN